MEPLVSVSTRWVSGAYTKSFVQASGLQSVDIEGRSTKLRRKPRGGGTQISPIEISNWMATGRTEHAAQALRLDRKGGSGGLHQMGWGV